MGNAAHDLADLLESWKTVGAGESMRSIRRLDDDSPASWARQVHAAQLLSEVGRYLEAMTLSGESVDHYQRSYPEWAKGVFAPWIDWTSSVQGQRPVVGQPAIDLLRAFGDVARSVGLTVSMSPVIAHTSTEALDELMECLRDPSVQLNEVERRYVFDLISSVRQVFEESSVLGSVNLLARVHELLGVMTMLADTLSESEETRGLAKKLLAATRRVVPYAKFGARVSAGTLGAAADFLQLTQGAG